jgi:hypothetical protein
MLPLSVIVQDIKDTENELEALKTEISKLSDKKRVLEDSIARDKAQLREQMRATKTKSAAYGDYFVSRETGRPSVKILDLSLIPEHFKSAKIEANKSAIKKALANGESIDGAELVLGDDILKIVKMEKETA